MKIDKYSAILGNTVGFHDMSTLTEHRPVASLPFGAKYRLIDFPLSSLANAGVRSVFGIFQQDNISSVFDHIRSGREWGLSTLLSHYYLGIYNTSVESSTVGKEYYQQLLTYLKRSGSNQTVALNCDIVVNIYILLPVVRLQLFIRNYLKRIFQMLMPSWKWMKQTMFFLINFLMPNQQMNFSTCLQIYSSLILRG